MTNWYALPPRYVINDFLNEHKLYAIGTTNSTICLLLDVVLSLSLALVFGTLSLPTSLQPLLWSLSENV